MSNNKVIKDIAITIIKPIAFLCSFFYTSGIIYKLDYLVDLFYSFQIKHQFAKMDGLIKHKIKLSGGKNISVGSNTIIAERVILETFTSYNNQLFNPSINIGNNSVINSDVYIYSTNNVMIGNNVAIAARTLITDTIHGDFRPGHFTFEKNENIPDVFLMNMFERPYVSPGPIVIEDNVHIGINCVILPGVTIGHNSVINAHSVVSKSIPPYSLVSGNPAKILMTFS